MEDALKFSLNKLSLRAGQNSRKNLKQRCPGGRKGKDTAEKSVDEQTRQLQPKRSHTHDDAGDAHEMIAEVDNWDLNVHRRETTCVQNLRNVEDPSTIN